MKQITSSLDSRPPDAHDDRLITLLDELEKGQVQFLDEAGKRLIDLSTALLGLLFAVAAFGEKFPPPYIKNNLFVKVVFVLVLLLYLGTLLVGFLGIRPRKYERYTYNQSGLREELNKITQYKSRFFYLGSILFFAGSVSLAILVAMIFLV